MTPDTPITLTDIATFAAIAGAIFSVLSALARAGIEYLTAKFGNRMTVAEQSAQCRFDHGEINALITTQNANISTMLKQNGEQIKALSDGNHAAELRHQILLAKLQRIEDHIDR
jgi:hypothetical protein